MHCLHCEAYNSDAAVICSQCGERMPTSPPTQTPPAPHDMPASERMQEPIPRQQPTQYRPSPAQRQAPVSSTNRNARLSRKERALPVDGSLQYKTRSSAKFFVIGMLLIALVIAAAWGAPLLIQRLKANTTTSAIASPDAPTIRSDTADGIAYHIITFRGEDGDIIYIPELKKNYTIISGVHEVKIPDSFFISDDQPEDQIEITLSPVLYAVGKKPKTLEPLQYQITIPSSPLVILSPQGKQANAYTSMYLIQIQVEPNSTVTIAGNDVSDLINANNIIASNVLVRPIGENYIPIVVKTKGYKTTTDQVIINRPHMDIDLEIDINTRDTSNSDKVTISGSTLPGATITVDPKSDTIKVNDNGSFSFKTSLQRYGANKITITASMPGKQDSMIEHTVIYSPNLDEYSRKAWAMNYTDLIKNQTAYQSAIYKCTGKVTSIISLQPYLFYFDVGKDGVEELLVVEMIKDKKIELTLGHIYDIYADVEGQYEGLPKLNGRFFFSSDTN